MLLQKLQRYMALHANLSTLAAQPQVRDGGLRKAEEIPLVWCDPLDPKALPQRLYHRM